MIRNTTSHINKFRKRSSINILCSILLLTACIYSYATTLPTDSIESSLPILSTCHTQKDISSLKNYEQTFVVITPEGCTTSITEIIVEKAITKVPLPKKTTISSELDEDLRISDLEQQNKQKQAKPKNSGILNFSTWWLFATIALVNMVSPGGAILVVITTSLACGFSRTLFTTLGHASAIVLASATVVFGLQFIIDSFSYVLIGFKFLAALYFIYLGIYQWKSKVNIFATLTTSATLKTRNISLYANGFLVGILNPHTLIFFTAFTPKVLDTSKSLTTQFIVIAVTYIFISISVLSAYAGAAVSVKRWFSLPKRVLWFKRISGAIFVILGVGVLRMRAGLL